jgi:phospholipid/cholesterol/gamma-HCH transport system substrate-binding protein
MTPVLSRRQLFGLLFAIAAASCLGAGLVYSIGQRHQLWSAPLVLETSFDRVHGAAVGTRVRLLGKDVGEVDAILMPERPSQPVTMRLRIDAAVRPLIRVDACARIVPEGLIGGKVVDLDPGTDAAPEVRSADHIASRPVADFGEIIARLDSSLNALTGSSIGKLMADPAAYQELVTMLRQGRGTLVSLQQDAEAIKSLPIVRGYVSDPLRELVRPECRSERRTYAETDLFEPGTAILTADGRQRLDWLATRLTAIRDSNSEIVVAAFAARTGVPQVGMTTAQRQSEAVCNYLINHHSVHKIGWFSRRKVTPIGCASDDLAMDAGNSLPCPCLDIIVHIPQG